MLKWVVELQFVQKNGFIQQMFLFGKYSYPIFVSEMKNRVLKYKMEFIGIILGAIVGGCYSYFVGCKSGTCMITSSPVNSSLYGALMGSLLFGMFKPENNKRKTNT